MRNFIFVIFISLALLVSCAPKSDVKPADKEVGTVTTDQQLAEQSEPKSTATIKLATTTSVDNSGLLAYLLPTFTNQTGIKVDVIAVGTGKALELGRAGDVDVVLVHAPEAEEEFISEGWGLSRNYICQNEFVVVGPESDPAGIKGSANAAEAFKKIMDSKSKFISRGDDSGTHKVELKVWETAGVKPSGEWYIEAGQGMGAVLTMAEEMQGYALTDTGTYYSMVDKLSLAIDYTGDPMLVNIYSILPLNPDKLPGLKHDEAMKLVEWITSEESKKLIVAFTANGHQLFRVQG